MNINTRFKPGDVVWVMEFNKPVKKKIIAIEVKALLSKEKVNSLSVEIVKAEVFYVFDERSGSASERDVAATRDELKQKIFE